MKQRRIEICGAIASGKTTLVNELEKEGFAPIYERFGDNPFLNDFYKDATYDNAFETEIVFMLLHTNLIKRKKSSCPIICDFSMFQDYCYGIQNLTGNALKIFISFYEYLVNTFFKPKLTIYLKCDVNVLMERICNRNRGMETSITVDYLQKSISTMECNISKAGEVIVIDSNKIDFRQKKNIKDILETIGHP